MRRLPGPRHLVLALAAVLAAWGLPGDRAVGAEVENSHGVAVIIGNAKYRHEHVPEATYAHRDAAVFRYYVLQVLGYDRDNVIVLRDADRATWSPFRQRPGQEGMLSRYLDPGGGSDVVVFYSGHGLPGPDSATTSSR